MTEEELEAVMEDIEVEADTLQPGDDMNEAVGDDALDEIMAKDANGDGVPDWCNPVTEMGAWLNFRKMRLWCAENGWTDFGPYGGVPSEEEDEGVGEGDAVIGARMGAEGEGDDYDDPMDAEGDDYLMDDVMDYEYDQTVEGDEDVS